MSNVDDILERYSKILKKQIKDHNPEPEIEYLSKEFIEFKKDTMPIFSRYEKWAKTIGLKVKLGQKDYERINRYLEIAHLEISPQETVGLSFACFFVLMFTNMVISAVVWTIDPAFPSLDRFPFFFFVLMTVISIFLGYYLYTMPERLAVRWKLKASSQMVPAILYSVIYMKHTSNLERAISFVSQHIEPPLGLDFKKILWDVQNGKYPTLKEALDKYLEFWKESNIEFVESFHLIESSLYEPNETRRVQILERALKVVLDGVYQNMLRYTHSTKSPLTNLYMLGIVLPTLGIALLPLASTLLGGAVQWTHLMIIFNVIIPFLVYYLTVQVMMKRPGGYGDTTIIEKNRHYPKYISKKPYYIGFAIAFPLLIIGLLPFIMQIDLLTIDINNPQDNSAILCIDSENCLKSDYNLKEMGLGFLGEGKMFSFIVKENGEVSGPYGIVAIILSLFIPFSVGLFFSISYYLKTKELIIDRENTQLLEKEFSSSLFTLGNRLGDGTPPEIAFAKVADSCKGQKTEQFFNIVNNNMRSMGMSMKDAIFNENSGAIVYFPSGLIATSMRILIESAKKGLSVAAQGLMSISEYAGNIEKINERLRDLLAEVISDMKSNMTFLAPLLSGIVVGLAAMINSILSQLAKLITLGTEETGVMGAGTLKTITEMFRVENMISPYFLQVSIGVYIIQVIFILTTTLVTIDSGEDKLKRTNEISKNLVRGMIIYLVVALTSIIALTLLSNVALIGLVG